MRNFLTLLLMGLASRVAQGDDWPMWRNNAARTNSTATPLPESLGVHWSLQLPPPRSAWPVEQTKLTFDRGYEPVVAGTRLLVPSMVEDNVTAFDTRTGSKRWCVVANGPVRFAPCVSQGRVYFVADDGFLYCVKLDDGSLLWKRRGGPANRLALGNDRLVSLWPARGAPVIADGVVYFAAGIWPFMGTFVHALNAETGNPIWENSGTGSTYTMQQHGSPAFAGVAPQGYLCVAGDLLLVPGGRTTPAAFRRSDGKQMWFDPSSRIVGKDLGGYAATGLEEGFLHGGYLFQSSNGRLLAKATGDIVATGDRLLTLDNGELFVRGNPQPPPSASGAPLRLVWAMAPEATGKSEWRFRLPELMEKLYLAAGERIYGTTKAGTLVAFDIPRMEPTLRVAWSLPGLGRVTNMIAGDSRLFVMNELGEIHCLGDRNEHGPAPEPEKKPAAHELEKTALPPDMEPLLTKQPDRQGYCLVLGLEQAATVEELIRRSEFHVVVWDNDASRILKWRTRWSAQGWYGRRVAIWEGEWDARQWPPYFASLIIAPQKIAQEQSAALKACLHPYRGVLAVPTSGDDGNHSWREKLTKACALRGDVTGEYALFFREGGPKDAGEWTHHNGDSANTLVSSDKLVRLPLGLLWFGGPSNAGLLPRHGHGPSPQVVGGRLFMEGPELLRATDPYTGRLLWERSLPKLGAFFDTKAHQPGAGATGGNFVSTADALYVAKGRLCLKLDARNGETVAEFSFPNSANEKEPPFWGSLCVLDEILVGTGRPYTPNMATPKSFSALESGLPCEASLELAALHRHTGQTLWRRSAALEFRHNAIVAGRHGKKTFVFCIDGVTPQRFKPSHPNFAAGPHTNSLMALDGQTGKVVWKTSDQIVGTFLCYSAEYDVLVEASSQARDRASDESGRGLAAFRGTTGELLWRSSETYLGPPMIHGSTIVTQGEGFQLLTGEKLRRPHPLTLANTAWSWQRNYGCNTAIGSTHLLTFRSTAAGFYDLERGGGTGNFGGFRSGCTNNLIPAGGILSAPDYTRDCTCSYQNQCSLALVHMPELEYWTFNAAPLSGNAIERVGINFGAPGDRRSADGTLWLEYPTVGGASPEISLNVTGSPMGKEPKYFRNFSWNDSAQPLSWVASSGMVGDADISISLASDKKKARAYTVRLVLGKAAPHDGKGYSIHVTLQGKPVLEQFSIEPSADDKETFLVREFPHIPTEGKLTIGLRGLSPEKPPILCGVELKAEN